MGYCGAVFEWALALPKGLSGSEIDEHSIRLTASDESVRNSSVAVIKRVHPHIPNSGASWIAAHLGPARRVSLEIDSELAIPTPPSLSPLQSKF
jgi:hypothetical protein